MSLHKNQEKHSFSDYNFDEMIEDLPKKKRIRRMLEDRLERKRLQEECKDEFNELSGEFDWDELYK